jgi:DNA-binding GntR family transcriptional regulator
MSTFAHRYEKAHVEHHEIFDAALSREAELAVEKLKAHLHKCFSFSLSAM